MKKLKKKERAKNLNTNPFVFYPEAELDFHNLGILTAFDIEKYLNEFIEDCYIAKMERVLVITGKGLVIKPLVNKLLKQNKYIRTFKQAGHFNGQSGAVEVTLNDGVPHR